MPVGRLNFPSVGHCERRSTTMPVNVDTMMQPLYEPMGVKILDSSETTRNCPFVNSWDVSHANPSSGISGSMDVNVPA